jgi:gliding motility-associated-like protein
MKKSLLIIAMLVSALIGFTPTETKASHWTGGDITYTYVSANTFLMRFRFYRDASGIGAPITINLCYSSNTLGFNSNVILNPLGPGVPITQTPCVPPGTGYNIEEYIYEGVVVLPQAASDWRFGFSECCRNGAITTIQPNDGYVYCTLDNLNFPTDNSPQFAFQPVTEFCVNNAFYFQQGASDPDGDSLVFSLTAALGAPVSCPHNPTSVTYLPGYSAAAPFSSSVPFTCDPNNGTIYFLPNLVQTGVMAVLVEEFDRFTQAKKGETIRDIQVNINANCNIIPPAYDSTFNANGVSVVVDGVTNLTCDDTTFYLVFDNSAQIQCGSIVPTDIRVTLPNGMPNPVVSAVGVTCVNGLADSILVTVLNPFPVGTSYAYTKIGNDGNTFLSECGSPMPELDSIALNLVDNSIIVVDSTSAITGCVFDEITLSFNQPLNCFGIAANGSDFTLVDANGVNIPIIGALCGGSANPNAPHYSNQLTIVVNPGSSGVGPLYITTQIGTDGNSFANSCDSYINASDTIAIVTVLNYIPVNLGQDLTVCDVAPYPLLVNSVGAPTAVFNWTLNGTSISTNDSLIANQSGTYVSTVSVGASCSGSDTIVVSLQPTPTVEITDGTIALPDTIQLCAGDAFPVLTATTTGTSFQWYQNGAIITGQTAATYTPTVAGVYSVQSLASGAPCIGSDQIRIIVNTNPVVALGSNQTVCSNQTNPTFTAPQIAGATYQWSVNGVPILSATSYQYQPPSLPGATYTYDVIVTTINGCTGAGTVDLTVIEIVPVVAGNDAAYCAGVAATGLDATTTGAVSYQWYDANGIITSATNATFTPATDVTTTYVVVVDFGNSCSATDTISINYVTQITLTTTDAAYCQGSTTTLTASGNVSGLTYTWTLNGNTAGTGATITTSGAGTYTVTGDFNGQCNGTTTAVVTEIENPTPTVTGSNYCDGDAIADINSNYPANGQFGTVYSWTQNGNSFGGNTQTITPQNVIGANTYVVTVTNTFGGVTCTQNASALVTINPIPEIGAIRDATYCADETPLSLDATPSSTVLGQTFTWTLNGTPIAGEILPVYNPAATVGTNVYEVETDLNGCKQTATATITVNALPTPALSATVKDVLYTDNVTFCLTETPLPQIIAGLINPNNYTYNWTLNGTLLVNTAATQTINAAGLYQVEVEDLNGCRNTDVITVIEIPCTLEFYNIITPNSDGKNDTFVIDNLENYVGRTLTIYNRWGKEVYANDKYDNKWDGGDLSAGSYFYILNADNGVDKKDYKGIVEIVREK